MRVQLCDFDPCGPMHDVRKWREGLGSVTLGSKCGIRNPTSLPEPKAFSLCLQGRLGGRMGWFLLTPCGSQDAQGSGDSPNLEQQGQAPPQEQQERCEIRPHEVIPNSPEDVGRQENGKEQTFKNSP